ncbi:MAG: hypothetical protein ACK4OH_03050 [Acidovorax temperans]|uniref:hypothetical protein n=1 Tax=Acidovorax temperans TaxID=80878 RepID=UPI00391C3145
MPLGLPEKISFAYSILVLTNPNKWSARRFPRTAVGLNNLVDMVAELGETAPVITRERWSHLIYPGVASATACSEASMNDISFEEPVDRFGRNSVNRLP